MNDKTQTLLQLVKENPDLPVIPMVHYEVIGDDRCCRWLGYFGKCHIGEYAAFNDRYYENREEFEEDYYDYNQEEINAQFNYNPCIRKIDIDMGLITKKRI